MPSKKAVLSKKGRQSISAGTIFRLLDLKSYPVVGWYKRTIPSGDEMQYQPDAGGISGL